jgi:hypothetical protein
MGITGRFQHAIKISSHSYFASLSAKTESKQPTHKKNSVQHNPCAATATSIGVFAYLSGAKPQDACHRDTFFEPSSFRPDWIMRKKGLIIGIIERYPFCGIFVQHERTTPPIILDGQF